MKHITQMKYPSQYLQIPCMQCGNLKYINKHYYNKNRTPDSKQFCSELCRNKFNDPLQYDIMKHVDSTNFCYLVGLIATDGHIGYPGCTKTTKTYYCNIKLNKKDCDILYKIKRIFGGSVRLDNISTMAWRVHNPQFIQYLVSIGLTNKKTYDLDLNTYFLNLTLENQNHFLRGVFDGDGSITIRTRKNKTKEWLQCNSSICSASYKFIELIQSKFNNGILTTRKKIQNKAATCDLYYYYMNGIKIIPNLKEIYNVNENTDLFIERKYNTYKIIENYYGSN